MCNPRCPLGPVLGAHAQGLLLGQPSVFRAFIIQHHDEVELSCTGLSNWPRRWCRKRCCRCWSRRRCCWCRCTRGVLISLQIPLQNMSLSILIFFINFLFSLSFYVPLVPTVVSLASHPFPTDPPRQGSACLSCPGEEHKAAFSCDVDITTKLDLLGDLASHVEVPLPRHRDGEQQGRRCRHAARR
jgi:hypothetical protein